MNKKQKQAENILQHGFKLNRIFKTDFGPVELCKKLHRLEVKACRANENLCNIEGYGQEKADKVWDSVEKSLDNILNFNALGIPVFVNTDPRGHALKIKDDFVREFNIDIPRDWGGYGILCPEF